MSSVLQTPPEAFHTFCPIGALSRVYAGLFGESNEKLWIQEVAWWGKRPHRPNLRAKNITTIVNSTVYRKRAAGKQKPLLWPRNPLDTHIGPQRLRNQDGTIRLLIILHHRNPGAPNGQSRPVQRVHKLAFPACLRLEPDSRAPRLKRFAV